MLDRCGRLRAEEGEEQDEEVEELIEAQAAAW